MIIIGVDFHPEFQQMASADTDTGEFAAPAGAYHETRQHSAALFTAEIDPPA